MFKSFVLGLYASGHSLHVRVTQTFAVNRFRTGAIYSMHSKTTHRLSFLKDGAKVELFFLKKPAKCRVYLENYVIARETVETFISSMSAVDFWGARHCLRPI